MGSLVRISVTIGFAGARAMGHSEGAGARTIHSMACTRCTAGLLPPQIRKYSDERGGFVRKHRTLTGSSIRPGETSGRRRAMARLLCVVLGGLLTVVSVGTQPAAAAPSGVPGIDVSNYQGAVNWPAVYRSGVRWTYILATDGYIGQQTHQPFINRYFTSQYSGSSQAGLIHGAYHFARLGRSNGTGVTQAQWFLAHGGRLRDSRTLPAALDLEETPCQLNRHDTRVWIANFLNTYLAATGRDAVIYTTPDFWSRCVGNWPQVTSRFPLWISNTGVSRPQVPSGWPYYTMWQWGIGPVSGVSGGVDRDVFNGSLSRLTALAAG